MKTKSTISRWNKLIILLPLYLSSCVLQGSTLQVAGSVYEDIPRGFDFPANKETLERFRDTENVSEMRRHAWHVWAGLTQEAKNGEAVWETWWSISETFTSTHTTVLGEERIIQRNFTPPRQFDNSSALLSQGTGEPLISFVLYNDAARNHIQSNKLYLESTLNGLNDQFDMSNAPTNERRIVEFPRDAIVLKTVWWVIKGEGLTPMPVWDFLPTQSITESNGFRTWSRVVAIDPSRDHIPPEEKIDVTYPGPNDKRENSRVISLNRLYHFKIATSEQAAAINAVQNVESVQVKEVQKDDYVALVALHYATKEIPDWVWATFWWHDRPDEGIYSIDRLPDVKGVWRNYLMDTTYSMSTPREYNGAFNSVYNPWLEAKFINGMSSNCMTCHQRAIWRHHGPVLFPSVPDKELDPDAPYFQHSLQLDYMWSIGREPILDINISLNDRLEK